jgi:hypothetical protein
MKNITTLKSGVKSARASGRECKSEVKPTGFFSLPFVYRPKRGYKNATNWCVEPTDDYLGACRIGSDYAGHFIQFLKDNPDRAGSNVLGIIVKDINFADESMAKGYWVGFFAHLERLILASAEQMDVFGYLNEVHAWEDAFRAEYLGKQVAA